VRRKMIDRAQHAANRVVLVNQLLLVGDCAPCRVAIMAAEEILPGSGMASWIPERPRLLFQRAYYSTEVKLDMMALDLLSSVEGAMSRSLLLRSLSRLSVLQLLLIFMATLWALAQPTLRPIAWLRVLLSARLHIRLVPLT